MCNRMGVLLLGVVLLSPAAALQAQDRNEHQTTNDQPRYYDRQGKDWHTWDQKESQSYERYRQENHLKDREFKKIPKKQQDQYFRWQHQHSDDAH
jgi:hypothetical protein